MPNTSKPKGYSAADMEAVSDNPEWTEADFKKAQRLDAILPELAQTIRRRGKQKAPTKTSVSIRLDAEVVEAYKATGSGWQAKLNTDLRKALRLD